MKTKSILLIVSLMMALAAQTQELTIKSMSAAPYDLSASTKRQLDLNSQPCALVKVQLPLPGAVFEGNVIGKTEYKTNEYWVYMTEGSKELHIKHPNYQRLVVNFPDYGIKSLHSLVTYKLELQLSKAADVDDMRERMEVMSLIESYRQCVSEKDSVLAASILSPSFKSVTAHIVKKKAGEEVKYSKQTKEQYINKLKAIWKHQQDISISFDNLTIEKWTQKSEYYLVTMVQTYKSSTYQDQGYVMMFCSVHKGILLHTWQPLNHRTDGEQINLFTSDDLLDILTK